VWLEHRADQSTRFIGIVNHVALYPLKVVKLALILKGFEMKYSLVLSVIFTGLFANSAGADKGIELAKKIDQANSGFKSELATVEMQLYNASGSKTIRKLKTKTREVANDGDQSLTIFLYPPDVKGTKLLTWAHKEKTDDQWLYLPSLKRVKRISGRGKTGSFMGSEFSFEDIGAQEFEKFNYEFFKEEELMVNGSKRKTWVLKRVPKDSSSGYSKQIIWHDQEYMNPHKIEYYNRKNELQKIATFKNYKKIKNWWRPSEVEMANQINRRRSVLVYSERKIGVGLKGSEFKPSKMKR